MKKILLTLLALGAMTVEAQQLVPQQRPENVSQTLIDAGTHKQLFPMTQTVNAEGYYEFCYADFINTSRCGAYGDDLYAYNVCIFLNQPELVGYKIYGVKAYGYIPRNSNSFTTEGLSDFSIWMSDKVANATPTIADVKVTPQNGTMEVMFDQPYEITSQGVAVGYKFKRDETDDKTVWSSTSMPVAFSEPKGLANAFYWTVGSGNFSDFSSMYGSSLITVYMKKDDQTVNDLKIDRVYGKPLFDPSTPLKVSFMMTNMGTATVNNITYHYELNGESKDVDYTLPQPIPMNVGKETEVKLDFGSIAEGGLYDVKVAITKVNGEPNTSSQPFEFRLKIKDNKPAPEYETEFCYGQGAISTMGVGSACTNSIAMKLANPALSGMKIVGMKVTNLMEKGIINYHAWMTNKLTSSMDNLIDDIDGNVNDGTLTCFFDFPVTLTDEGVYVGYTFTVDKLDDANKYPIPYYKAPQTPESMWLKTNNNEWYDYSQNFGPATITVFLQGNVLENGAVLGDVKSSTVMNLNEPAFISYEIINKGTTDIDNIDYTYTLDNDPEALGYMDVKIKGGVGQSKTVQFPLPELTTKGLHRLVFNITKVNGVENLADGRTDTVNLCVPTFEAKKRPLMEEFTGLWCGWCTRGWLAMKLFNERIEDFVGLAYHNNDPMTVTTDYPVMVSSFPNSSIDRGVTMDPYQGGATGQFSTFNVYQAAAKKRGYADIALNSEWNVDSTELKVTVVPTFGACESDQYSVGVVLMENGLTDPEWAQKNSYSGLAYGGELAALCEMPNLVYGMIFDDVVIDATFCKGIPNSLPATLELDKPYPVTQVFQTGSIESQAGYQLIQNRDNIYVVAFILNSKNEVVNAIKLKAGNATVGINDMNVDKADKAEYYDIMGRKITNPGNGLYIRKEGNVAKKVLK